jgi:hypothetical protein
MKSFNVLVLFLLLVGTANAQTIGDHLNDIRAEKPGGKFEAHENNLYTYSLINEEVPNDMIYLLDEDLICVSISIFPKSGAARQAFIEVLNENWVRIDDTTWNYYRNDGMILNCRISKVESLGMVFYVSEKILN